MADFTSSVEIVFGVIDNASSGIRGLSSTAGDFSRKLEEGTQPLANLTGSILTFNAALLATGAALVGFSINQSVQAESAFADLGKVAGSSAAEVEAAFGSKITDRVDAFGVGIVDVTGQLTDFVQSGLSVEEALVAVDTALQATVISELSASQAADVLKGSLAGFEISATELPGLLDTLNATSNLFNVTAGRLGASLSILSPVASKLGLDFKETSALLTPVLSQFQDGDRSARGMQIALLNLATVGTKEVRKELERLKVPFEDVNGNALAGEIILDNLAQSYQGMTKEQKLSTSAIIAGNSQAGRFVVAMDGIGSGLQQIAPLQGTFTDLSLKGAEALLGVGVATNDADGKLRLAENVIKDLTKAWPTLTDEQKKNVTTSLAGADQADVLAGALGGTAKAQTAYLIALESAGSAQAEFDVRSQTTDFVLKKLSSSVGLLAKGLGDEFLGSFNAAAKGALSFSKALRDAVSSEALDPLFKALTDKFGAIGPLLEGIAKAFPDALKLLDFSPILKSLDSVSDSLGGLFDGIDLTTPEGLAKAMQLAIGGIAGLITTTEGIVKGLSPVIALIGELVVQFSELSPDVIIAGASLLGIGTSLNLISGPINATVKSLDLLWSATKLLGGASGFGGLVSKLGTFLGTAGIATTATASLATVLGAAGLAGAAGFAFAQATGLDKKVNDLPQAFGGLVNDVLGTNLALGSFGTEAFDAVDGIGELGTAVKDTAVSGFNAVLGQASDYLKFLGADSAAAAIENQKLDESLKVIGESIDGVPLADYVASLRDGSVSVQEFAEKTQLSVPYVENLKNSTKGAATEIANFNAATSTGAGFLAEYGDRFAASIANVEGLSGSLEQVGVAALDQEGNFRPIADVVTDLSLKWGDLDDAQKLAIAAMAAGGANAGAFAAEMDYLSGATTGASVAWADSAGNVHLLDEALVKILYNSGLTSAQLKKMGEETLALNRAFIDIDDGAEEAASSIELTGESTRKANESFAEYTKRMGEAGQINKDVTSQLGEFNTGVDEQNKIFAKINEDGIPEFTGGVKKAGEASKKSAEETDKQTKAANDLQIKLEEINSNERIKLFEAKFELNIKSLEEDTKRIEAAFESVDTTVVSTGEVISSALSALGDVGGFNNLEQLDIIEKQLEIENKNRKEALELQKKLTESQIENIKQKTKSLENGDALIKITGDGLEPELEAFMFKILKKIQLRASAEGADFLLGIETPA
jgi:TP901 family phage tail tape measure protein